MGDCRECGGSGVVQEDAVDLGSSKPQKITVPCPECNGSGKTRDPEDLDIG